MEPSVFPRVESLLNQAGVPFQGRLPLAGLDGVEDAYVDLEAFGLTTDPAFEGDTTVWAIDDGDYDFYGETYDMYARTAAHKLLPLAFERAGEHYEPVRVEVPIHEEGRRGVPGAKGRQDLRRRRRVRTVVEGQRDAVPGESLAAGHVAIECLKGNRPEARLFQAGQRALETSEAVGQVREHPIGLGGPDAVKHQRRHDPRFTETFHSSDSE